MRRLHRQMEFLDEVEGVVARDAREIEIFGEQQHEQNGYRPGRASRGEGTRGPRVRFRRRGTVEMMALVPAAHFPQDANRENGREREPGDAGSPVRNDDQGRKQRSDGAARVAADLKNRLRQTVLPARGQARDARGFGVGDRGPGADGRRRHQHAGIVGRERERSRARSGSRPCLSSANTLAGACRYTRRPAAAVRRRRSGT